MNNDKEIDVWGDGSQTRSYLFVDDCIEATLKLFNSNKHGPINIGSEEQVSINQMIEMIESIAKYEVIKKYDLSKPVGVKGRSSNNELIKKQLNWSPKLNLYEGLSITYDWIETMIKKNVNSSSIFTLKY